MAGLSGAELRALRIFATIVKAGGIAGAQLELNLSQSTISTHLANLERRLRARLCQRGRGGFRLTEAGRVVFEAASQLLGAAEHFSTRTSALDGRLAGVLRIGIVDATVGNPYLPLQTLLARYAARAPEVHLDLLIGNPLDLEQQLLDGRRDIAIGAFFRPVSGLAYEPLYVEEQALYCGRGHPLFSVPERQITMERIRASRFVGRGYMHRLDMERLGHTQSGATVEDMEAQATLILTGRFIGYLPAHYAGAWVRAGQMRALLRENLHYDSPFSAVFRRDAQDGLVVKAFLEDLRAERAKAEQGPLAAVWRARDPGRPAPMMTRGKTRRSS